MSLAKILEEEKALENEMFGKIVDDPAEAATTEPLDTEPTEEVETRTEATEVTPQEVQEESTGEAKTRQSWKQRFTNYKASTDKTISTLRKENTQLYTQLSQRDKHIDDLSLKLSTMTSNAKDPLAEVITEKDIDEIGPEAVDVLKRLNKKSTEVAMTPIKEELERLKAKEIADRNRRAEEQRRSAYGSFIADLGRAVPDYAAINLDTKFAEFMDEVDPYTGEKRVEAFRRAEDYLDVDRVADFFIEYKESGRKSKQSILEDKITPVSSTSSNRAPIENKAKETFTVKEVEKFFDDVTKGVYRNRRKDSEEIEARITRAYINGNII